MRKENSSALSSDSLFLLSRPETQTTSLIQAIRFILGDRARLHREGRTLPSSWLIYTLPSAQGYLLLRQDITPKTTPETPKSSRWTLTKQSLIKARSAIISRYARMQESLFKSWTGRQ